MNTPIKRSGRRWLLAGLAAGAVACTVVPTASAATTKRAVDPTTLTPAPPDFFGAQCATTGQQIICTLAFVDPVSPVLEPSGIVCGSGAQSFEVLDTWTRSVEGKRFYDADGLLVRRHFSDRWQGTFTNPDTGATVSYTRRNSYLHDLAVPGDVATGVEHDTLRFLLTTPKGNVVLESGVVVLSKEDDSITFEAGKHRFDDYFAGDPAALAAVCDALS